MDGPSDTATTLAIIAAAVGLLAAAIGGLAVTGQPGQEVAAQPPTVDGSSTDGLERLHRAGITGEGVRVGVVDVTGFDVDNPSIEDRVVAARAFSPGEGVANGGRNGHGTAAASIVARVAPDADLYLASFDSAAGYRDAVGWMREQGVDVIVAPVSFYGKPGDGSSRVARVADSAVEGGTVFVAPAGNVGQGHWEGRFRSVEGGTHLFDEGTRNYLATDDARTVRLWLSWSRDAGERDFDLELHRVDGADSHLVARSQPFLADPNPNERVVARVEPNASYFFVVRGPANATDVRIEVTSPTTVFQFTRREGSVVAPATAESVVAVGAYDADDRRLEPFTAAGPVGAGRPGVDVVAPDRRPVAGRPDGFVGSSAAAPYVAGLAALVLEVDPDCDPREVERVITRGSRDVGRPGVDPVAGHGVVVPGRTIELAMNASADR